MTAISGTTTLVGILGWPVDHSLSPRMHNAAFAALGLDWAYVPLPVPTEQVGPAIAGLQALGFAGANVTIPHKTAVIPFCDELEEHAGRAGTVNTLVVRDGRVHGSSTDIVALRRAVHSAGRRVLVLGRGGAAKAAAAAYADAAALVLCSRRDPSWPPSSAEADVIVNCTPLKEECPVVVESRHVVVDMAYRPDGGETALVAAARAAGCEIVVDGLDLLLWQGAAGFTLWTGLQAPAEIMRAALRG